MVLVRGVVGLIGGWLGGNIRIIIIRLLLSTKVENLIPSFEICFLKFH